MSELKKHIIQTFGFSEDEFQQVKDFFKPKVILEGDYFLKEGQYVKLMGFVEKGILREFLFVNDKEVTKWFSTSGYFAVDLSGFLFEQKSKVTYQAMTDAELLTISKEDYDKISTRVKRWDKLEKMFLAKCFIVLENRVVSHLALNAEERYDQLFAFNPTLFNEVPLNQIASMLGMTAETLSRIRKKQTKMTS
ncbi:cyclic nucleotide-binding domain-containing protein [Zeaxanthinibacter sp. PT1]|uniref:Crp/Fnr family transcriptional regulator n=1 Tax=Zeaxanthinibacter TaxID=561554 RepID=UPI002349C556|nr:cyclic nucleotide-binding domain-containing protein [Zeaxanthinibacter sp. PT1]MDC6350060.1 cyclic nucleotide-binding domain-containing protein [Zeaxanthinibacter sp. PT1]